MKWFCAQIGAREHYAIPRVLYREGRLASLYTDFWAGGLVRSMAGTTKAKTFRSLATRFHSELARATVVSWNLRALSWEAGLRRQGVGYGGFARVGSEFASRVRDALKKRTDLDSGIFYAYDTGALEAFEWCRERGVRCILNQMDPNRVEAVMVQEEEKRWPGWTLQPLEIPQDYFRRREKEWALADVVVVNSEFCRDALVKQGVPPKKLAVVPLSYERREGEEGNGAASGRESVSLSTLHSAISAPRLRVLYLGQVILRKGIQYLIEAAKLLVNEPIHFDVVGPIGISPAAVAWAPANMTFHGRATRDQTAAWYQQSDVFVLPTLSDGFALTQLEAMSYGLPVIATPCCGAVVTDGVDGFIVPVRDAKALAKTIQRYAAERGLLESQRVAAGAKVQHFTMGHLAEKLRKLEVEGHHPSREPAEDK